MAINVLFNTRLLMQRLGFLKVVCYLTEPNSVMGREKLIEDFFNLIGTASSIPIKLEEIGQDGKSVYSEYKKYLEFFRLQDEERQRSLQLQDAFLSSPLLPSQTGSINSMEMNDFVELALDLALLRKVTCNLSPSGHLLKKLFTTPEQSQFIDTFKSRKLLVDSNWYRDLMSNPQKNILLLSEREKTFFLYKLIKYDGVALYFAYKKCMQKCYIRDNQYSTFKRYQNEFDGEKKWAGFGDLFGNRKGPAESLEAPDAGVFEDILKIYSRLHYDSGIRGNLASLAKAGDLIARNRKDLENSSDEDLRSTVRHVCTIRLEPFVDIGLLRRIKNPRLDYEYQFTEEGIIFFSYFISFMDRFVGEDINKLSHNFKKGDNLLVDEIRAIKSDSAYFLFQYAIEIFLRTKFFYSVNEAFSFGSKKIDNLTQLVDLLKDKEKYVLDVFGYRPIEELFLISMFEERKYIEIYDAENLFKQPKIKKAVLRPSEIRFLTSSIKLL